MDSGASHSGALMWAITNGMSLGVGATTRVGFWLWFVIPAVALLYGDVLVGMLIYGTYGFLRGGLIWPMIEVSRRHGGRTVAMWLLQRQQRARRVSAFILVLSGITVTGAIALFRIGSPSPVSTPDGVTR